MEHGHLILTERLTVCVFVSNTETFMKDNTEFSERQNIYQLCIARKTTPKTICPIDMNKKRKEKKKREKKTQQIHGSPLSILSIFTHRNWKQIHWFGWIYEKRIIILIYGRRNALVYFQYWKKCEREKNGLKQKCRQLTRQRRRRSVTKHKRKNYLISGWSKVQVGQHFYGDLSIALFTVLIYLMSRME